MSYEKYKLESPNLSLVDSEKVFASWGSKEEDFGKYFNKSNTPYLYWDKFRFGAPFKGLTLEESWLSVRRFRDIMLNETFLKAESGEPFKWIKLPNTDEFLHEIDMYTGGKVTAQAQSFEGDSKLIVRGIMEESIASSQLEGAHTTRCAAKKMLSEGRQPKNDSEQMILNNYRVMTMIDEDFKGQDLSMDLMFEMHKLLTDGTLAVEEQGRLRKNDDDIVVSGMIGTEMYVSHVPPNEDFLAKEMERLVLFANDKEDGGFTHPIIKAIFLHFWIGYLHPFTDGNGRLARALFYWYLLKKGYWMMMYLPISTMIKKAPSQYSMAYIRTEQDSFDLTYFFEFNIKKIIASMADFGDYLDRKLKENKELDSILEEEEIVNDRQKSLLYYLLESDGASSTMTSHAELNNISRQTAAKDLKILEDHGLLVSRREGKYTRYYASDGAKKLREKI